MEVDRAKFHGPASRAAAVAAHISGLAMIVLLLVWLLHYREGIDLNSDNGLQIFNVHPFLMVFGFLFMAGQAMMAYKTVGAQKKVQKSIHMFLHLAAIVMGIVGLHAVFKYHDRLDIPNMYSLHSWIGITTFSLYCMQWLFGLVVFFFPGAKTEVRARATPWHVNGGRVLLFMALCAAVTGLMEKVTFMRLQHQPETRAVNVLGLVILLFGISVDLSVSLGQLA